jgi:type IV pilus assembly protein PilW
MNKYTTRRTKQKQGGMSLVELMVGLIIGVVLAVAAAAVFMATSRSGRDHDEGAKMLEEGTFALSRIAAAVRREGFVDVVSKKSSIVAVFDSTNVLNDSTNTGKKDRFGMVYGTSTRMVAGIFGCTDSRFDASGTCVAGGQSDALAVAYQVAFTPGQADLSPSVPAVVAPGSAFADCNGMPPPAGTVFVLNRYFLNAQNQLMCLGNGSANAQIMAQNVEEFSVLYGVLDFNTWTSTRPVVWQTAAWVTTNNAWNAVVQADLCLIMWGPVGTDSAASRRLNCDGTTTDTTDGRKRTTFRKVVDFRNTAL